MDTLYMFMGALCPVSYTHLDVYKRQAMEAAATAEETAVAREPEA